MTFYTDEAGAVTVDWVVLTAGLVGLGLAAMAVVSSGVEDLSTDTSNELSGTVVTTGFRTASDVDYGLFRAPVFLDASFAVQTGNMEGLDVASLQAEYLSSQAYLQADIDNQIQGKGTTVHYHRMLVIAGMLQEQGEPLPDGSVAASDMAAQLNTYHTAMQSVYQ